MTLIQHTYSSWITVQKHIHHNTKQNVGTDYTQTAKNKEKISSHFCSKYVLIKMTRMLTLKKYMHKKLGFVNTCNSSPVSNRTIRQFKTTEIWKGNQWERH